MFLTMKLGAFVRLVLVVALVVLVLVAVMTGPRSVPEVPTPAQPVPTERAGSLEAPVFLRKWGMLTPT
ncbi:hypothetical protein JOF56_008560 [Kibdelosporangium banguiense]|uniref:Uncharacterized protein n=1 Tax=Kibdelosporangium banguiense TaxID=1365924 RepID=A0ABS4TW45_9PSEU|nr:hypothetical protein [Kibdelosporangium banguiense]